MTVRARRPAPPVVQVISTAITTISVLLLGFAVYIGFVARLHHDRAQFTSYANFRQQLALATAPTGPMTPEDAKKPLSLGTPVAVLNIPALGLNEVVFEGTTGAVLEDGPGHLRSTPLPGQAGTSVVMGKSTTYGGPFGSLASLVPGDPITVTTGQGVHKYVVLDVRRAGLPAPKAPGAGGGRLVLTTAEGGPFAPGEVLRVDADLTSPAQPKPGVAAPRLTAAEPAMAIDRTAWFWLVVVGEALVGSVVLLSWALVVWGRWQTWLVAVPVLGFFGIAVADQAARLLPNLL
jgi:sortase A